MSEVDNKTSKREVLGRLVREVWQAGIPLAGGRVMWKFVDGNWLRPCTKCLGRGQETLPKRCSCPWRHVTVIDHPDNSEDVMSGLIGHRLYRCDKCGKVWRIYYETQDESVDIPGPEFVGYEIPPIKPSNSGGGGG